MNEGSTNAGSTDGLFGPIHVIEPRAPHTHTVILLHGRESDGEEFANELFDSELSGQCSLADKFPTWRWAFPSSREYWSETFQENLPAWFEASSLTDVNARQDLQAPGIKDSVDHIWSVLDKEILTLDGMIERVVLGGISQGAAVAMWALLCSKYPSRRLGAFFVASSWLPFSETIDVHFQSVFDKTSKPASDDESGRFVESSMVPLVRMLKHVPNPSSLLSTPLLLGHGSDDAYVDISLGVQARDTLISIGFNVQWSTYEGAEQEGHWFKTPDQINDIANFLSRLEKPLS